MASEGQDRADALGWGRGFTPTDLRPSLANRTIPQEVTAVSIYDKGPEPCSKARTPARPIRVLLAEVPYLVRRGHPNVLPCALRKVVNHALEFRLSSPDEHTLQRVLRFPGFPQLVYLPFLIVHRAPLVGGGDTPKDAPTLSSRAQLLRTLLLGTSVHISSRASIPLLAASPLAW